ncbi:sugar phosphate isomerase/epimerase family protein [Actinomadura roseirufa]|uniref:sugar phosphate isomerase/epimerase family protein n=1 Tax=Actinomadura roseirufa TaxID=2094049 RepID=UPI001040F236|nr:sugar phosphate isomerase/epimerase [Actinomadura roseirufa]
MKLGVFTACMPDRSLEFIAQRAEQGGFASLEIACWPGHDSRPFTAAHLDAARFGQSEAEHVLDLLKRHRLTVSSLGYYDNPLHPDPVVRTAVLAHLHRVIDAAAAVGAPTVGTFIGRDPGHSVQWNLREAEQVFPELVDHAERAGVGIVIENCVMEGWHPDGYPGNLAYSPELWEWMFTLGLYLNYDPSHLVWLGIDPAAAISPYARWIKHVQAKDVQILPHQRQRYGWPGKAVNRAANPWDTGWWRYRVPGRGEVDWRAVIDALAEGGYDGTISIEHEDPVWSGSTDRVLAGLEIARRTLQPLLIP